MEHWDELDISILKFLFTSETKGWLNILGWEGGSRSRCNWIYKYLVCETGRILWNKRTEMKMTEV